MVFLTHSNTGFYSLQWSCMLMRFGFVDENKGENIAFCSFYTYFRCTSPYGPTPGLFRALRL